MSREREIAKEIYDICVLGCDVPWCQGGGSCEECKEKIDRSEKALREYGDERVTALFADFDWPPDPEICKTNLKELCESLHDYFEWIVELRTKLEKLEGVVEAAKKTLRMNFLKGEVPEDGCDCEVCSLARLLNGLKTEGGDDD